MSFTWSLSDTNINDYIDLNDIGHNDIEGVLAFTSSLIDMNLCDITNLNDMGYMTWA